MGNLYFAYGSNLSIEQMVSRCPESIPVCKAKLNNHRLVYKANKGGRGVADVEFELGFTVYGMVYEISDSDTKTLDRFEGVPTTYNKHYLDVELEDGSFVSCLTYLMNAEFDYCIPGMDYFKRIKKGYEDWKIDPKILMEELITFKGDFPESVENYNDIQERKKIIQPIKKIGEQKKYQNQTYTKDIHGTYKKYKTKTPVGYTPSNFS